MINVTFQPKRHFSDFVIGEQQLVQSLDKMNDHVQMIVQIMLSGWVDPFRPEFTIVIFIHYKPRIAVAILDL